jgi:hypothetical protein
MTSSRSDSDSDGTILESPRSKKSLSASPPSLQTNSRLISNTSSLGLNKAGSRIEKHTGDLEDGTLESPANSDRSSYASTLSASQTTPVPVSPARSSPLTGQSTSPVSSSPLTPQSNSPPALSRSNLSDTPSILSMLPMLLAISPKPKPQITMPEDDVIIAGAEDTNILYAAVENNLLNSIIESYSFNTTFTQDPRIYIRGIIAHIWEENLEILSLARYNRHVGIYYPHGLNKTVMATGRAVRNREEFFKPENVSFLTQYGAKANFKVPSLQELNPKVEDTAENFDFSDAIIFLPICYTARHALIGNEFFEVLKYFVFEKHCSIMVYLGRDSGLEENKVKRERWIGDNLTYIEQVKALHPEFWKNNQNILITITHRHELVKTPQYLYAEYYFSRYLASKSAIRNAVVTDVVERLTQKNFLTLPTKPMSIKHSAKAPSTPQLSASPSISLFPRPHSHPSAARISTSAQSMAINIIEDVINSKTPEELRTLTDITREMVFPQKHNGDRNPFALIYETSVLKAAVTRKETSSDDEDEEEKQPLTPTLRK